MRGVLDRSSAIRRVAILDLVVLTTATMTSPPRATGPGAMPARGTVRRCCFATRPAVCGTLLDPRLTAPSDGGCRTNRSAKWCVNQSWDHSARIDLELRFFWDEATKTVRIRRLRPTVARANSSGPFAQRPPWKAIANRLLPPSTDAEARRQPITRR